jgi:acyl-CoA reductase-like NAD-dependent aldehyde dehydrogenase
MQTIDVTSPYDGSVVGKVTLSSHGEIQKAIDEAYDKFIHEELPKYKRVQILENLVNIMSEQKEALTKLCASEGGKPWIDSQVEVDRAIGGVKLAIEALNSLEGKEIAMGQTQSSMGRIAFTTYEPIGVVASISAFNHPLNLAVLRRLVQFA